MVDTAQVTDRMPTPTFGAPHAQRYDPENERTFRRQVEKTMADVITYAGRLTRQGGDLIFDADQIEFLNIATAAYSGLQEMRNVVQSAGWISGGVVSGSVAPAKLAEDTFTDTNGVQLTAHTADSGFGQWAGISYFTIQSNQAQSASAFNRRTHTGNAITSGKTVFTVEATLTNASSDGLGSWGFGWHSDTQTNVALYTRTYIRCAQLSSPSERMNIYLGYQYSNVRSEEVLIGSAKAWAWSAAKKIGVVVDVTTATPNYTVWWSDSDDSNYEVLCTDQEFVSNVPVVTNHYCDLYQDQASTEKYYVDNFIVYDGEWLGGTPGVDVTAGEGSLRSSASNVASLYFIEWAASTGNTAPTDGNTKYVGVEYNSGAPQLVFSDTYAWDFQTDFPIGQVYNNSGSLEVTQRELSRHFPKGVNVGTWLDVGTTLDVTGAVTLSSTLDVAGAGQFDTDVTIDGNLYLPTMGLIQYDQYHAITLDAGATASWVSGDSITLDIDGDNSGTSSFFKVRRNLTDTLLLVEENGDLTTLRTIYIGSTGTIASEAYPQNSMDFDSSMGGADHSVAVTSTDEYRIYIDVDEDTTTADFSVYHGSGFGTLVFNVKEDGQVDVPTGPLIVGTDPGGSQLLRVGGTSFFDDQVRVTDGSNNIYLNKTGSAIFECGTDGSVDSTYIRAGNQGSPATNNPAYYWSIRSDNSIMIYGYDGSTYRNLWEWNYATNSVKAKAATFYIDSTQVLPTAASTTDIGSATYYLNDVYLERIRANAYLYAYPYATGTGGSYLYLDGYAGTPTMYTRASTGTYSSKLAIGSYSSLGVWAGQGWDGTNWFTGASITLASASSAWSGTDHGSNIYFATTAEASTTVTTRWRILPAGDFIPYADNAYDLGHSSYRVQDIHAMGLYCTADYAVVNPASSAESLPTNMTNGLIVRRDGGTAPAFNSAHMAGFISASAAGTNAYVSIISGNTGSAALFFGDTDSYGSAGIGYNHNLSQFWVKSEGDINLRDPNASELATSATAGFVRIPTMAGAPSGTPATVTGTAAVVYDRSNHHLKVYDPTHAAWETFHSQQFGYDEMTTPVGTTSATLEDVTGASITITFPASKESVIVMCSFQCSTQSGAAPSVLGVAINGDGTDSVELQRSLSGATDAGIGALMVQFTNIDAGSRTFKLRFRRVSGTATPGIDSATMYVIAQ